MPRAEPPQTCEQLEAEWPTILRAIEATADASDELAALKAWLDKASAALSSSSVSAGDASGNRVLALMRDGLAMVEELKGAAFPDTSRESDSPFEMSIEEEMHGQWAIGVRRSMRLFEDKLELWSRAIEAEREADLLQRRLTASHQALPLSLPATSDQEALAMTLSRETQMQREQEELQLALALSESEAATPPPAPAPQTELREPLVVHATVVAPPAGDVGFFGRWCRRLTPSCLRRRREEPAAAVPTIAAQPGTLRPAQIERD